jgi:hypothetical protein
MGPIPPCSLRCSITYHHRCEGWKRAFWTDSPFFPYFPLVGLLYYRQRSSAFVEFYMEAKEGQATSSH